MRIVMSAEDEPKKVRIIAYGVELAGLTVPDKPIEDRNFTLTFEKFSTSKRFQEFDGVIIFQGIFETFERKSNYTSSWLSHKYDKDELDKRLKELKLLLQNGGFACFMMTQPFIDHSDGYKYEDTDLTKIALNYHSFYRENFGKRTANLEIKRDEFRHFLEIYGAASTHFKNYNDHVDLRVIAETNGRVTAFILFDEMIFIPCLLPDNNHERVEEFFRLLTDALISTRKKIQVEIPAWVKEFEFVEENQLLKTRIDLVTEIEHIDSKLRQLDQFKRILVCDGDALVEGVRDVFSMGFGLKVDEIDELREDLKILNENNEPFMFIEIKGTNRGVKRENINQTDSHRERADLLPTFPALLIMNTHIKNTRTLHEKNQDVALEQVSHARKTNVLILRTYDLLELLKMYLSGELIIDEVKTLLTTNSGWLQVVDQKVHLLPE